MPCRPDSLLLLAQDVPDGQGFVCIPGSHKRNFMPPDNTGLQSLSGEGIPQISLYDGPPTVANLCPRAGSCIVFTEALRHGIRRWHAEYPRLTVFNRCALDAHPGDSLSPHAVLTLMNACGCTSDKANWPVPYWGGRAAAVAESTDAGWQPSLLDQCASQISAEMQLLQGPSVAPKL
jgi:hypothetical protein